MTITQAGFRLERDETQPATADENIFDRSQRVEPSDPIGMRRKWYAPEALMRKKEKPE